MRTSFIHPLISIKATNKSDYFEDMPHRTEGALISALAEMKPEDHDSETYWPILPLDDMQSHQQKFVQFSALATFWNEPSDPWRLRLPKEFIAYVTEPEQERDRNFIKATFVWKGSSKRYTLPGRYGK